MKKRIVVLGGTGLFGKPTVDQLLKDGFQVRVLARDPEKAKSLLPEEAEVIPGDVTDLVSLESAMTDCWGAHISVGGPVDRLSAENVASLAPKLGLQRIGYISGATVAEDNRWFPMVAQKLDAEKVLRECGVPYTIFCPTWPMEQIARFARDGKPFLIGKQPLPVHFFASEDLARMISTAFRKEEAAGKRFYIYGPEALSMPEALARYCQVMHPDVEKVSAMPIWMAKTIAGLTRNETMKFAANLMGYFDKTQEGGDPSEADRMLGAPEITLDEWVNSRK